MSTPIVRDIRAALRAGADPARAPQMQAYMKSAMPYLGVRLPRVRAIVRDATRSGPVGDAAAILWREAQFREERYAATALLVGRMELATLPLLHEMILTGAWWDHVDELAHRVGELLRAHPAQLRPVVVAWSRDPDRWLRRTSVICQRGAKDATDLELLTGVIEANAADPDFFLRKAIGWALRDYARADPSWVRAFVAAHELSPLSRREALKHLG